MVKVLNVMVKLRCPLIKEIFEEEVLPPVKMRVGLSKLESAVRKCQAR